jgi:pyruvate dehydrogenase E1 component alpha subunit
MARTKSQAKAARKPAPRKKAPASRETLLKRYRDMLLIRRFEEKAGQLYGMGLIGGFCHLYIGQEAVVTGMMAAVTPEDVVITAYRDHGHMLACGMDPAGVMAELTGRSGGYSKGKGGSMHMFSVEKHFYGGHGIVGAQVPIGTGLGFGLKYQDHKREGPPRVCLTFLGEGAANQGQVYEAFNMGALWGLPVVYVIENNKYGMGTAEERATAGAGLYRRGEAYGIPGMRVDGMDVLAVEKAGKKAVAHCRAGKGPYLLEMITYRYRGHSMSDPAKYRSKEEVAKIRAEKDPVEHVREILLKYKLADEDELKETDREVREAVSKAAEFAQASPEPDPSELYTDVLVEA